jgi:hypothetical protein
MTVPEILDALGLKASVLVAGFAGGALRAFSTRNHKKRELIVSPICGALAAGYLTGAAVHFMRTMSIPLPDDPVAAWGAVGFLIGVCAMWITDALLEILVRRFKGPALGADDR